MVCSSSSCSGAACCQESSCYFGGYLPNTGCDPDRGSTSCSSMMKGSCVCHTGSCGSTGKCGGSSNQGTSSNQKGKQSSTSSLFKSLRLWDLVDDDHHHQSIPREDHTVGLMTYGLIVAATAGISVRWALGGRRRTRTRTRALEGLRRIGGDEWLELQGHCGP